MSTSISVSGMRAADLVVTARADNVANVNSEGYAPVRVDLTAQAGGGVSATASRADGPGVDLADETVGTTLGARAYTANARVLSMALAAQRSVLDVLA